MCDQRWRCAKLFYKTGLLHADIGGNVDRLWLDLDLTAVATQATDAAARGQRLLDLREEYRQPYQGKPPMRVLDVIDSLFTAPVQTIVGLSRRLGLEFNSVRNVVKRLVDDGLVVESTGMRRNRVFVAREIVGILAAE